AAAGQADARLRRDVPGDQLRGDRHLDPAVARLRRPGQRLFPVRPARLDLGLPHRLGEADPHPARRPHPPLQPGHAAPAPARALSFASSPAAMPELAAMVSASSCEVTGPSNFFATSPSGSIRKVSGRPRGVSKSAGGAYTSSGAIA